MVRDLAEDVVRRSLEDFTELLRTRKNLCASEDARRKLQEALDAIDQSSTTSDEGEQDIGQKSEPDTTVSLAVQLKRLKTNDEELGHWLWYTGESSKDYTGLKDENRALAEIRHQMEHSRDIAEARIQRETRMAERETWLLERAVAWYEHSSHRRGQSSGGGEIAEGTSHTDTEKGPSTWADELYWTNILYIQASFMDILGGERADYDDYVSSFEEKNKEYQQRRVGVVSTQWVKSRNPGDSRSGGNINW